MSNHLQNDIGPVGEILASKIIYFKYYFKYLSISESLILSLSLILRLKTTDFKSPSVTYQLHIQISHIFISQLLLMGKI